MIFEIEPEHISALDSLDLVRLMKRLLLAESRFADIPLRAAHVPLQITVPDGGEDGRIEWSAGRAETDYFPSRFTLFQSKAQNLTSAALRTEILRVTKSANKNPSPQLKEAIRDLLARRGSYVIFCSATFTARKKNTLIAAIKAAISEGGGDPAQATAIEIYDANTISDWVNACPPVALWLASRRLGRPLHGFQTHESWGRSPEIAAVPWQPSELPRFAPQNRVPLIAETTGPALPLWPYEQAAAAIGNFLSNDGAVIRIAGPSGYGKTRFVYEALRGDPNVVADTIDASLVMYVDGSISGDQVVNLALEMAETRSCGILVVDECPDDLHWKLCQMVQRAGSRLRLVTMDIETKVSAGTNLLSIRIEKTDHKHIEAIAKGVTPGLGDSDASFIADLAEGFPRMAVLAAQQNGDGRQALQSVDQIVDRIVWGANLRDKDAQRVLELSSLFDWFGLEGRVSNQAAWIAKELGSISDNLFVEHLLSFLPRGIVTKRGDFAQIGPIPLAVHLGMRRLQRMSADQLLQLFDAAPPELKSSFLIRLKWLDTSPVTREFAELILDPARLGNLAVLNTEGGSKLLDRLVEVNPDTVAVTAERVFGKLTIEELQAIKDGRRHLVWTLEKLAFRQTSFERATRLLRRLAVVETERYSNNATGIFKQFFQLYLSGTEAEPPLRLLVLDEGLCSDNPREREICIEALDEMLETGHFSRSGGSEQIGSNEPLTDWQPKTYGEIRNYLRAAVSRLIAITTSDDPFAAKSKSILGSHIRGLLQSLPFDDVKVIVETITARDGVWVQAIHKISEWLFFDRKEAPPELSAQVRQFYESLLPADLVDRAILFTDGWQTDMHDPDAMYDENIHDFDYSTREAEKLAKQIAVDSHLLDKAINRMACSQGHTLFPFSQALVSVAENPIALFSQALEVADQSDAQPNQGFFKGLIWGADQRNHTLAQTFIGLALKKPKLRKDAISFIGSGRLQTDDLALVISLLKSGEVTPSEAEFLSYGRGLEHLTDAELMPFLHELEQHDTEGLWAVLTISHMLFAGDSDRVPTPNLLKLLKRVLLASSLLKRARRNTDGHHLEQAVNRLAKQKQITAAYAKKLSKQLLRICGRRADSAFSELQGPIRSSLSTITQLYPDQVWEEIAKKLTSKSRLDRFYTERFLTLRHTDDYLGRGIGIDIQPDTFLKWVRAAPLERAPQAVSWLPIAVKGENGTLKWHAEMEAFVTEFGDQPGVLRAILTRLHPSSWWGSLAPYLESTLSLIETWLSHKNPVVRAFANEVIGPLKRKILDEKKRSEEDVVRFNQ